MNRRPPTRIAALLLAVLFLLNGAESAFGMHKCPHHDLLIESGGGHAVHEMAGHDMAAMGGHSDHQQPSHSGPCTCQGACQMGSAAALPVAPAFAPDATVSFVATPRLRAEDRLARRLSRFFLPYSQAPPRVG